ncbi:MAG: PEP-CTERM sorting domain-containing protein [Nostoc sp.]|uniref:PEP-CTERM sorting domain-containing protein n=1 Tax=Nostoc sp. TaxID=1180 RepID=UPI002FF3CE7E
MRTLNILKTVSAVAAASVVAVIATGGKASAININLAGSVLNEDELQFNYSPPTTPSGINLTATGIVQGLFAPQSRNVYRSTSGLGVSPGVFNLETNQVDGSVRPETLILTFNTTVNLNSVTFADAGPFSSFTLNNNLPQLITSSTYVFTSAQTGTIFGFKASLPRDRFFVSSIDITPVPEPITLAGMVMGSGFGVLLFRKYKKAAKFSSKLSS